MRPCRDDRLWARAAVRRLHHARRRAGRRGGGALEARRPRRPRPRHVPGPPVPGALPRHLDADLGRRRADDQRAARPERGQPAAATAGRARPQRREPRHPQRRPGRAGARGGRVLGRDRGARRPASSRPASRSTRSPRRSRSSAPSWNAAGGPIRHEGEHYRIVGAHPGPAPAHDVEIWLGAYKRRMLALTGAKADGWLPSQAYVELGDLQGMNDAIDRAAEEAGRRAGRGAPAVQRQRVVRERRRVPRGRPARLGGAAQRADAEHRDERVHPGRLLVRGHPALRRGGRARGPRARQRRAQRGGGAARAGGGPAPASASRAVRRHAHPGRRAAAERRAAVGRDDAPHRPAARTRTAATRPTSRRPAAT